MLSATALCLTACGHTTVIDEGCGWTRTITVSHDDVLTDGTAAQIVEHNEVRRMVCAPR